MKSFIAFDRHKIYTSLQNPDPNPNDHKLSLLLELTYELGRFGFVLDQEALLYLSEEDILDYKKDIIPVLYDLYYHKKYDPHSKQPIYLEDWKSRRKQPWIDNFYLSGDFRFITESANSLNLPTTFLDRLNSVGLWGIYRSLVESRNITPDYEILKYLAELYKDREKLKPGNQISTLVLSLYDQSIRPNVWSDYKLIHPGRKERRLILEKLEGLDLEKESRADLKELLRLLHPAEYKKLFPKVYTYWTTKKKENSENSYTKAKDILDSGNIEEFKKRFVGFLYDATKEKLGLESDIMLLLYSPKLKVLDLTDILGELGKIELGCPRWYGDRIYYSYPDHVVPLIPTIKEFIYSGIGNRVGKEDIGGKKVWIDPKLKLYDFGNHDPRKKYMRLGKVEGNIEIQVKWKETDCFYSDLNVYAWRGPGKVFKSIRSFKYNSDDSTKIETAKGKIDILSLKDRGFKYLVFDNRVSQIGKLRDLEFSITPEKGSVLKLFPKTEVRNNLGGLIDLASGDVYVLNFDISKIPTINGNIKEAIVRYVLPEYRFSAYDFAKIYIQSSGAEITEDPKQSDSTFEYADYMKINPI